MHVWAHQVAEKWAHIGGMMGGFEVGNLLQLAPVAEIPPELRKRWSAAISRFHMSTAEQAMSTNDLTLVTSELSRAILALPSAEAFLARGKAYFGQGTDFYGLALHDFEQALELDELDDEETAECLRHASEIRGRLGTDRHGHVRSQWQTWPAARRHNKALASIQREISGLCRRSGRALELGQMCSHLHEEGCDLRWPWEAASPEQGDHLALQTMRLCVQLDQLPLVDPGTDIRLSDSAFARRCLLHLRCNGVKLEPCALLVLGEGLMYAKGVPRDLETARICLEAAARGSNKREGGTYLPDKFTEGHMKRTIANAEANACISLLEMHCSSPGSISDVQGLKKLAKDAADRTNSPDLAHMVARCYHHGQLWPAKPKSYVRWLKKAAAGHRSGKAALELGQLYAAGIEGVLEPNRELTTKWNKIALADPDVPVYEKMKLQSQAAAGSNMFDYMQAAAPHLAKHGLSSPAESVAGASTRCSACGKIETETAKLMTCSGCRSTKYCSKGCQKRAWKEGHKLACKAIINAAKTAASSSE